MPKYPDITIKLVGEDGNVFNILGICLQSMFSAGLSMEECQRFQAEATSGDYNHLLRICMEWFNIE